jgi:hypothetical protein
MKVIQHPTWSDISAMITPHDIKEMKEHGLDLSDYNEVYALAHKIYYYVGYKLMPLGEPWTDNQIATYNNWLIDGRPKDAAHREEIAKQRAAAVAEASTRVRKDITQLNGTEIKTLKAAFKGLMAGDPKTADEYDPDKLCYFSLAAKHWYPIPTYCQHHIFGFLPWHRWQMIDFENALRSVKGCEDVTLPYWNIETGEFPAIFSEEPFNGYTFPIDVYPDFVDRGKDAVGRKGTKTQRNASFENKTLVNNAIDDSRTAITFADYNGLSGYNKYKTGHQLMRAHDLGHVGSGPTMANQDIAAFDPIFWFFHCNWDRLWWEWQVSRKATTLEGFKKTLSSDYDHRWLTDPQMSISDPFGKTNADSIDATQLGISYTKPEKEVVPMEADALPLAIGPSWRAPNHGQSLKSTFTIDKANLDRVSLRVKGVNRIKVPGSFYVVLYLGGEEVGRDAFFQATFSGNCENCVAQARIEFDFVFDRKHLSDKAGNPKEIEVKVISALNGEEIPFDSIGDPTINIRMLH